MWLPSSENDAVGKWQVSRDMKKGYGKRDIYERILSVPFVF